MRSVGRGVVALLAPALLGGAGSAVALALVLGPTAPVPAAAATRPCVGMIVDGRLAGGSLRTGCATGDPRSGSPPSPPPASAMPSCRGSRARSARSTACRSAPATAATPTGPTGTGPRAPTAGSTPARAPRPTTRSPGDTEAWVWQEGGKRPPPDIVFGTALPAGGGCRPRAPPTRRCRRPRRPRPPPRPSGSGDVRAAGPHHDTAGAEAEPEANPHDVRRSIDPARDNHHRGRHSSAVPHASPVASTDDGGGPPWAGLAVGVAVVALLGGAAVTRARRTGGSRDPASCARCTPAPGGCGRPGWRRRPAAPPTRCCSG